MKTTDEVAHALICSDFVRWFDEACLEAGGGSWDSLKGKTLEEVMHILAPNGLRIEYFEKSHIDEFHDKAVEMALALPFLHLSALDTTPVNTQ